MNLYTIGFTQKSAEVFFDLLSSNGIECLMDIRLHPDGQLAGFSKRNDLQYFLKELIGCDYRHIDQLAPTDELLKKYRLEKDWSNYEKGFLTLMDQRNIPAVLDRTLFTEKRCCLLCSESKPEHCHRRLVAEKISKEWGGINIIHL